MYYSLVFAVLVKLPVLNVTMNLVVLMGMLGMNKIGGTYEGFKDEYSDAKKQI